jgi:hypothetical protein
LLHSRRPSGPEKASGRSQSKPGSIAAEELFRPLAQRRVNFINTSQSAFPGHTVVRLFEGQELLTAKIAEKSRREREKQLAFFLVVSQGTKCDCRTSVGRELPINITSTGM